MADAAPTPPSAPIAADTSAPTDSEIVVTGSRIARSQFEAPYPVSTFDAVAVEQSGRTNLTDFLRRIPALSGSRDSSGSAGNNAAFGQAGLNLLSLRNLGSSRTLVLVDGRRHVAGNPGTAAVDINTIPTDLVERVDVLTGGASAIYGADGVSGVVNFVLKHDFQGVSVRGQSGISQYGDAANRFVSAVAGTNFAGGRGNITATYEYDADQRLYDLDRKRQRNGIADVLVRNPADDPDDPKVADNIFLRDIRYIDTSPDGAVDVDGDFVPDFTSSGAPYNHGRELADGLTQGGSSTPTEGYLGDILPRIRRHTANLIGHFDVSDALKLSLEGKFAYTRSFTIEQPTYDYYTEIALDNPFLPAFARDAAIANGTIPNVTRDNFDFGTQGEDDVRRTWRGVADVSGRISDHASYDVYYTYGRTSSRITRTNNRLGDRFFAAVDAVTDPATGQPTCRSNIDPDASFVIEPTTFTPGPNSGCVPVNLFGYGSPSRGALDFFLVDDVSRSLITQNVVSGALTGDFGAFFAFPGGPLKFSIGGEYRRESSKVTPSHYLQNGEIYDDLVRVPSSGKFDVKEAFAELNAPILENARFARLLSFGAAIRFSDYSTVGKTTTWQVNGVYAPVSDVSFRGSYSEAVRAPNIGELFAPVQGIFGSLSDPCDLSNLNNGTQFRQANCKALLSGLGVDPASFEPSRSSQASVEILGESGGNPGLREETAKTWTAGLVLRPRFIPGFTAAFDWYDIRLRGAINTPGAQQIAELCVDQPTLDNGFCPLITRDPASGFIDGFSVRPQNVAAFRTAGLDANLDYRFDLGKVGQFDVRLVGNYLDKLSFIGTPGADPVDSSDIGDAPRWQANLGVDWTKGALTLTYNLQWSDKTLRFDRATIAGDPDYVDAKYLTVKSSWQHDVRAEVRVGENYAFYAGVNNLLNEQPAIGFANFPVSAVGRYFYAGFKIRAGRR